MKKIIDLSIIALIYAVSIVLGYLSFFWIGNIYVAIFLGDVIATIVVWFISLFFRNSSIYDPYWSLVPWLILGFFFIKYEAYQSIPNIIVFVVFSFWSWRLTINWILNFTDFTYEDWRYKHYRETSSPLMFHIINFTGIMMVPTLLVYAGLLPLLVLYKEAPASQNYFSLIGASIILLGTILELVSDIQMRNHLKSENRKQICTRGLWKYSRHPNYLGENLIWIGTFATLIGVLPQYFWLCFGAILILLLFEFVSIPLMENRQKSRREGYFSYIKSTSRMLVLPPKKNKEEEEEQPQEI